MTVVYSVSNDVCRDVAGVVVVTKVETGGLYERYAEQNAAPLPLRYATSEGQLTSPESVISTAVTLCSMV
jgi:hypothetical protein